MAVSNKVSVTIRFSKPGLQSPIFLAGSFSEPSWQPQEMQHILDEHNEHQFHKTVEIEEGKEYQYKFRIGNGDWWVLDEDSEIATDNIGNRNNQLIAPLSKESKKQSEPLEETKMEPPHEDVKEPTSTNAAQNASQHKYEPTVVSSDVKTVPSTKVDVIHDEGHTEEPKTVDVDGPAPPLIAVSNSSTPHHDGDIADTSSEGSKDERLLKTRAAEPDYVVVRSENRTPDIASSAAEVADSAQNLDQRSPTPPITDEEAGRIGYRRMSQTPIPEVADVAAEVADSAAILDKDDSSIKINLPPPTIDFSSSEGSGNVTPWEERAPQFPHECPELPHGDLRPASREQYEGNGPRDPFENSPVDLNDPSLEQFPSNRAAIYEQVRSSQRRMSEDQVSIEGIPPSPVVGANHNPERLDIPAPSPNLLARPEERSPSLDAIAEEPSYREELLTALPKALTAPKSSPDFEGVGNSSDDSRQVTSVSGHGDSAPFTPQESDEHSHSEAEHVGNATTSDDDHPLIPGSSRDTEQIVEAGQKSGLTIAKDSPTLSIYPPITGASTSDSSTPLVDTAKASAFERESQPNKLKSRKANTAAIEQRPLTPNSVRSGGKDANSKNFLKSFLKLVFVDWIGGLIMRLCGGGRHTLVAITALIFLAVAPALYFTA